MKKICLVMILILVSTFLVNAQLEVTLGNGVLEGEYDIAHEALLAAGGQGICITFDFSTTPIVKKVILEIDQINGSWSFWRGTMESRPDQWGSDSGTFSLNLSGRGVLHISTCYVNATVSWSGEMENDFPEEGTLKMINNNSSNDLIIQDYADKSMGTINSTSSTYSKSMLLLEQPKSNRKLGLSPSKISSNTSLGISSVGDMHQTADRFFFKTGSTDVLTLLEGKVGIGTTSPSAPLHVNGDVIFDYSAYDYSSIRIGHQSNDRIYADNSSTKHFGGGMFFRVNDSGSGYIDAMMITENGNVGIGEKHPAEKLTVNGNLHLSNGENTTISSSSHNLTFSGISTGYCHRDYIFRPGWGSQGNTHSKIRLQTANTSSAFTDKVLIHSSGTSYFNGGSVGIGTTDTYGYKLAVNGTIGAKEVKIINPLTADFVFQDDYQLRSLSEVESFVKENKHLPEIPSAKAMKENGIGISQMNQLLLQKVEELTLYMIEQQKEIEALKSAVEQ